MNETTLNDNSNSALVKTSIIDSETLRNGQLIAIVSDVFNLWNNKWDYDMDKQLHHYDDVTMSEIASRITSLMIVYSTVHSVADQSNHQSSASLAFVWEIHRWPVNFPHKGPVTRKIFPFDDVIMQCIIWDVITHQSTEFSVWDVITPPFPNFKDK